MEDENRIKKLLTNVDECDILIKLIYKTKMSNVKKAKINLKMLLTSDCECDNINKLSLRRQQRKRSLIIK